MEDAALGNSREVKNKLTTTSRDMPKKPIQIRHNRQGPDFLSEKFEGQIELLGQPFDYVKTMLVPEDHEPVRVPDDQMATSAIFKAPQIVSNLPYGGKWDATAQLTASPDAGAETTVLVFPGTNGAIAHTLQEKHELLGGVVFLPSYYSGNPTSDLAGNTCSHGLRNNDILLIPRRGVNGDHIFEVHDLDDAVINISATWQNSNPEAVRIELTMWAGAVPTIVPGSVPVYNGTGIAESFVVPPGPFSGFSLRLTTTSGRALTGLRFGVEITGPGTPFLPEFSAGAYRVVNMEQLAGMQLTSVERPAALSALVTYMGSTLKDGGNVAGARLAMAGTLANAPRGDYFAFLANLPVYAANYPLRDGCYAWWCPDSVEEYFFRTYGAYACDDITKRSHLAFSIRRDEPDQAVRLRVDYNVETQTRSAQYNSRVSDYSSAFSRGLEIAKLFPAVTVNDEHKGVLARIFDKAKRWLARPANWVKMLRLGTRVLTGL